MPFSLTNDGVAFPSVIVNEEGVALVSVSLSEGGELFQIESLIETSIIQS